MDRAVKPFSSLLGWAITACGALGVLNILNVNIRPLLAVGGVGGIAVGFGAQEVTSNALSGLNLVRLLLPKPSLVRVLAWPKILGVCCSSIRVESVAVGFRAQVTSNALSGLNLVS